MYSLEEARTRWDATFACGANLSALRSSVRSDTDQNPCVVGLRSVCWKSFLVFENLDRSTWPKTITNSRSAYVSLKQHFLRGIRDPDAASSADPLADDDASPWNTLRQDELLREEILQDVERCMPDITYFREPATQDLLLDVLFIFCKLNGDIGYRQGMHELLAPILWVVSRDAIDNESSTKQGDDELMLSVLDRRYVEHDAFTIFCIVMQTAKSFYEMAGGSQAASTADITESPIVTRSRRIHEDYLRKTDPELTTHLTSIDILPQIFVIRWIRLLFGREFPLEDVLCVWDILFAEDPGLNLVDLVCVAMLLRVRWQLLEADYTSALTLLLRYPAPKAPYTSMTFVEDALYLRSNLNGEGGNYLISKYTGDAPTAAQSATRPSRQRRNTLRTPHGSTDLGRGMPSRSPSQFLIDSGGIEGIIQEAAKGVYRRGEKWGVNQALRGAVQQLQAANSSPRRSLSNVRKQFGDGADTSDEAKQLSKRIIALEERNKTLAKMLHDTMQDLTNQARKFEGNKADEDANALTLVVAKLQFVQVYLENSSLPLNDDPTSTGKEDLDSNPTESAEASSEALEKSSERTDEKNDRQAHASPTTSDNADSSSRVPRIVAESPTRTYVPSRRRQTQNRQPISKSPPSKSDGDSSLGSLFQQSRPSLAQSSFSWMLGSDGHEPGNFVAASPFTPEKERQKTPDNQKNAARKKASFLFGDEKRDKDDARSGGTKAQNSDEVDDGFSMGTLTAPGVVNQ